MEEVKGTVGIPKEYFFTMGTRDYTSYESALPREFYQNSIDAGASQITVEFDDEEKTITITDDGCGMDRDIILNKLLVLGGSHKAEGSVGAFGKAKEILYFAWIKYCIRSNYCVVNGENDKFTLTNGEFFPGTKVIIWIEEKEYKKLKGWFRIVAQKNETKCKIIIDGEEIEPVYKKGKFLKEVDFGTFYLQEGVNDIQYHVRINGIWMFSKWIEGSELGGRLILELNKSSLELLTSNRDSMKSPHQRELEKITNQMVIDTISFLRPEKKRIRKLIEGLGRAMKRDEFKKKIETILDTLPTFGLSVEVLAQMGNIPIEVMQDRVKEISSRNFDEYEAAFWASYKPNFVLLYEQGESEKVDKFVNSRKAETLAVLWTEVVKQVLIDNNMFDKDFTAGFVFDDSMLAGIESDEENYPIIYLNPFKVGRSIGLDDSNLLSKRSLLIECLKDSAIHELAHLNTSYHSEYFVQSAERLRENTHGKNKNYNAIAKIRV